MDERPGSSAGCLRCASLFSNLSGEEIVRFQDVAQSGLMSKAKFYIFRMNLPNIFYVICGGWIKLFHTMPEGDEVIVDMLTTGHMVGESAIFEQGHHTSSAQVIEDVQLLSIPSSLLKEQIRLSPSTRAEHAFFHVAASSASLRRDCA